MSKPDVYDLFPKSRQTAFVPEAKPAFQVSGRLCVRNITPFPNAFEIVFEAKQPFQMF
jgi:hypothetical protein